MDNSNNNNDTILLISVSDNLKVKPDTAVMNIIIGNRDDNDLCNTYEEASKIGAEKMANLVSTIKNLGVQQDYIKVNRLIVSPVYTNVTNKKENNSLFGSKESETSYSKKLIGYSYNSKIILKIPVSEANIAKVYCKMASDESAKSVCIDYILVDTETWHDKLLEKIIEKARHKAEIIAKASDMKVDKIKNINLNPRNRGFGSVLKMNSFECDDCSFDESFEENISTSLDIMANSEQEISENLEISFKLK